MAEETTAAAPDAPAVAPAAPRKGGRLSAEEVAAHMDALDKGEEAATDDAAEEGSDEADSEEVDGDADDAEAEDEDSDESPDADADLQKRIGKVQQNEKRSRDQAELTRLELLRDIDRQKAAFEAEWKPRLEESNRLRDIFERAKDDPSILADELNWDAETQIKVGERLWAFGHDKKGDPKFKQTAENMRRDSESRRESSALKRQVAELASRLEEQDAERRVEAVAAKAASALGDRTPVLKSLKPEYVQARIRLATQHIRKATGQDPDPADVVAKLEQIERQDLLERVGKEKFDSLGFGPSKAGATPKQKTKTAEKKETAPPMKPTPKYSPPNRRRSAEEILAEMDAQGSDA